MPCYQPLERHLRYLALLQHQHLGLISIPTNYDHYPESIEPLRALPTQYLEKTAFLRGKFSSSKARSVIGLGSLSGVPGVFHSFIIVIKQLWWGCILWPSSSHLQFTQRNEGSSKEIQRKLLLSEYLSII